MQRRKFLRNTVGASLALHPVLKLWNRDSSGFVRDTKVANNYITSGPPTPLTIYNNWSSYDELSDNAPLTEELAMRELNEVIRLKKNGVQFDYYMMDAFWFDKMGGYRVWHKEHWPNGPDRWLNACKENNIKPGMWFSTNLIATRSGRFLEVIPEWKDSLATDPNIMCLFSGGYLNHLGQTLQLWYNKGVRAFKFDFAYFEATTEAAKQAHLPEVIEEMNKLALMDMLKQFRVRNPDVLITGYNGFGGDMDNTYAPFKKTVDPRWLEVFDTIYCGDPRFADVPAMNIWRAQDIYSDHMVRQFEFNGLPLRRIDNCGFMTGKTGTCYYRADHAWKGMLILELARGGWVNVYHGNMELINDRDAQWFSKTQSMFHNLQQYGLWSTFGGIPGNAKPYGFKAEGINGTVVTLVNPSQSIATIELPVNKYTKAVVLFADGGFKPIISDKIATLGPEQLVVAGFDEYAGEKYNLGTDNSVRIPLTIDKIQADFKKTGNNNIESQIKAPTGKDIRILLQQFDNWGFPYRSWGGAPPDGKKMNEFLKIEVTQNGKPVPMQIQYDKMIWSGLSWGAAEIKANDINPALPLSIQCKTTETVSLELKAEVYAVKYAD